MNKILGIIAGEGNMPIYIARNAYQRGYEVVVLGMKGNAREADYKEYCKTFKLVRLGQLNEGIEFFKEHGVTQVVMAGRVQHTSIFSNFMPDKRALALLTSLKSMQANHILSRLIEEFAKEGIQFQNSALFLDEFFPSKGVLSTRKPTAQEQQTIDYGFGIAKQIAALDIGLTCVVSQQAVIAVEGMEGTDRCIARAGELYKKAAEKESAVAVVKVARPNQDNRYDLPVIGKTTLKNIHKAGFSILAFEAGKTLVMDLDEVVALANKLNICLVAI
ncbi:MAG: UDP-2,3-diacylglucosamine diphosphatase LpxI [Elusimicrobiaceae bacterium]|nr:UDP-2,3-diacylglucosamine diphosphatase LpxI [Elusimicrobiaceae bacterium]